MNFAYKYKWNIKQLGFKFIRREVRKGDNNKKIGLIVGVKMITLRILGRIKRKE